MDPKGNVPDKTDPQHRKDGPAKRTPSESSNWFGDGKRVDPKTPRETREGRR